MTMILTERHARGDAGESRLRVYNLFPMMRFIAGDMIISKFTAQAARLFLSRRCHENNDGLLYWKALGSRARLVISF